MIKKDDQRLPDYYCIEIYYHGEEEAKKYEIAEHKIIDKVYEPMLIEGKKVFKCIGPSPGPYFEYRTKDDRYGIIPLNSIKELVFDKSYSKLVDLKKELDAKSRSQRGDVVNA